jgi:YegS/Rv2252/BmrU family lipid kinase
MRVNHAPFERLLVIANPKAGQDDNAHETLAELLRVAPLQADVYLIEDSDDARRKAQQAAAEGYDVVAAHGGDGTVMKVADGLRETSIPLAIIPGGTANVMSVELGIPRDLAQAVALITGGQHQLRAVDMGRVNDHHFLLRIGIGWEAEISVGADSDIKARFGSVAYMQSALNAMRDIQPVHYHMTLDGQPVEADGINLSICNSGNLGVPALALAPNILINDSLLDVVIIQNSDIGSLVSLISNIVTNALPFTQPSEALHHWQARSITVTADPPQTVTCDGEVAENPFPLHVEVLPAAIRVVVPEPI